MSEIEPRIFSKPIDPIELGIHDDLNRVAQEIVRNKYLLDYSVTDDGGAMLAGDLHDGGYGPHEPMPFLSKIVPFIFTVEWSPSFVLGAVPTSNTIGCSWRWRRKHLNASEAQRVVEELSDADALGNGTLNPTSYSWIKPLGLIAPHEGKNRVHFFRDEGIDFIPAKIYERDYPAAERIEVFSIQENGFSTTWAVLDGRWVEKVEHPNWTLPLMKAYGAKTNAAWPSHYPDVQQVVLAQFEAKRVTSPFGHPEFGNAEVVDLDTIRTIEAFQAELQQVSVLDLKEVQVNPLLWIAGLPTFVVCLILLGLVPAGWVDFRILLGMIAGAAGCAASLPFTTRIVTTRRGNLSKASYFPPDLAPKRHDRSSKRHLG